MQLRPYQKQIVTEVRAAYVQGHRAPLVVLPTGGGKTTIFSHIATATAARGKTVWVVAHRAELVKQIAMTLARFGTEHRIIAQPRIIRQCQIAQFHAFGRSLANGSSNVVVASVQTLVKRMDSTPPPDLIVVDEGHHLTVDSTWGRVVTAYPKARLLIVTATPCRLDGKGLGAGHGGYADIMIQGPPPAELIEWGNLSRFRWLGTPHQIDLSGVKRRAGDYAPEALAEAIDKPAITGSAVEHYLQIVPGKRAVAFCVSVEHAEHVAAQFRQSGIPAESLDGTLDPGERDQRIDRFVKGQTLILTSADIISEGFDVPAIEAAILLRPTESLSLFLQQVGRALRPFEGKAEAVILDHVGAWKRHGFPDDAREWTLEGVKKASRAKPEAPEDEDAHATQCQKCFTVHRTAPECPSCGHVYPPKVRKVDEVEGHLQEITRAQAELLARQKRAMQGKAQTIEELIAQGISRPRAAIIVKAREEKAALIDSLLDRLQHHRESSGLSIYQAWGVTVSDVRRMKPKALRDMMEIVSADIAARSRRS